MLRKHEEEWKAFEALKKLVYESISEIDKTPIILDDNSPPIAPGYYF